MATTLLWCLLAFCQDSTTHLEKLIGELKSSSKEHQEIAAIAIKAHGAAAVPLLQKAEVGQDVLAELLEPSERDRALVKALTDLPVGPLSLDKVPLKDALRIIQGESSAGPILLFDPGLGNKQVSLRLLGNGTVAQALEAIASQSGLKIHGIAGRIVLASERPLPPARAPLRVSDSSEVAERALQHLGSDSLEEQELAEATLSKLGFGAERVLWKALDVPSGDARRRAGILLRTLYSPDFDPWGSLERDPLQNHTTFTVRGGDLASQLSIVGRTTDAYFVFHAEVGDPAKIKVTLQVEDLSVGQVLEKMLPPLNLKAHAVAGLILIAPEATTVPRSLSTGTIWSSPQEADRWADLLRKFILGDDGREIAALGTPALTPLLQACGILEGDAARRGVALRATILREASKPGVRVPSGFELQQLSAKQKAMLAKRVAVAYPGGAPLEKVLEATGARVRMAASRTLSLHLDVDARLDTLLRTVIRPYGLDFYVDGDTVVVDTNDHVKEKVEK